MRKLLAITAILFGSLCILSGTSVADQPEEVAEDKVTICHRTNADNNPYVQITVDSHAVDGEAGEPGQADHYDEHVGPVWNDTLKDDKIEWGDIIPPVEGFHEGLNWTEEGIAFYENDCAVPAEETTTTTEATTTTTVEETTTTVAVDETSTDRRVKAQGAVEATELPRTGSSELVLTGIGVALIAGGSIMVRRSTLMG